MKVLRFTQDSNERFSNDARTGFAVNARVDATNADTHIHQQQQPELAYKKSLLTLAGCRG